MKKHNASKVVLALVTIALLGFSIFAPDKDWSNIVKIVLALVDMFLIIGCLNEKHNTLKAILVTMLMFMLLTWMIPAAYYSGEFLDQGRIQIGLFDLFSYPLTTLSYFGSISLYILLVGGFYGILYVIPAYRSFLDKIVNLLKGKSLLVICILMVLLGAITSVCGLQLALLAFFPMLASIILLMGYDKVVVALTLVGSTMIGVAGTTFGFSNAGLLNSVLGLDYSDNWIVKVVILIAGLVLLIFNTIMYVRRQKVAGKNVLAAEKTVVKTEEIVEAIKVEEVVEEKTETKKSTKKNTTTKGAGKNAKSTSKTKKSTSKKTATTTKGKSSSKSSKKDIKAAAKGDDVIIVKESLVDDSLEKFVPTVVNSKHSVWPIVVMFILLFVIVILAFTPWSTVFKLDVFTKASEAVTKFELFKFPIFAKLLGEFTSFGEWSVTELTVVLAFISLLLVVIYGVKMEDAIDGFVKGIKKALVPSFIVFIIYTLLVLTTYHPFQLTIYKAVLGLTKGFNVVTASVVTILTGLFNSDPSYAFQAVVPYFTSVVTNDKMYPIAGILFQAIYGVSMLVVPTSLTLSVVLSYLGLSYKEWFKAIWKLLVELIVVLLLVFTLLVLI